MLWRPNWRPRRIAWCDDRESVILLCVERHCRVQNLFYFSGADEYLPKEKFSEGWWSPSLGKTTGVAA